METITTNFIPDLYNGVKDLASDYVWDKTNQQYKYRCISNRLGLSISEHINTYKGSDITLHHDTDCTLPTRLQNNCMVTHTPR